MAEIMLTEENFETEVIKSDIPVLIDFFATWCGPCMMIAPHLEELADEFDDRVKICKVDVDTAPSLAEKFNVSVIPTLVFLKNGEIVSTTVGYKTKDELKKIISE
ncbi:MAG: thioredoxin [Clostridia bacterium]|nr:thioredoxin [Clostridia bacterium]